jgi:hypothetical protein
VNTNHTRDTWKCEWMRANENTTHTCDARMTELILFLSPCQCVLIFYAAVVLIWRVIGWTVYIFGLLSWCTICKASCILDILLWIPIHKETFSDFVKTFTVCFWTWDTLSPKGFTEDGTFLAWRWAMGLIREARFTMCSLCKQCGGEFIIISTF